MQRVRAVSPSTVTSAGSPSPTPLGRRTLAEASCGDSLRISCTSWLRAVLASLRVQNQGQVRRSLACDQRPTRPRRCLTGVLMAYREHRIISEDGLGLDFRDYGDPSLAATPLLCLSGLFRNGRDFEPFARRFAVERRVLCPDLRGRSDYDPDRGNHQPETYLNDISRLLRLANIHRFAVVGTSFGGVLAMALGAFLPFSLAGVVLNDAGPEIEPQNEVKHLPISASTDHSPIGRGRRRQSGRRHPVRISDRRDVPSDGPQYLSQGRGRVTTLRLGCEYRQADHWNSRRVPRPLALFPGTSSDSTARLSGRVFGFIARRMFRADGPRVPRCPPRDRAQDGSCPDPD